MSSAQAIEKDMDSVAFIDDADEYTSHTSASELKTEDEEMVLDTVIVPFVPKRKPKTQAATLRCRTKSPKVISCEFLDSSGKYHSNLSSITSNNIWSLKSLYVAADLLWRKVLRESVKLTLIKSLISLCFHFGWKWLIIFDYFCCSGGTTSLWGRHVAKGVPTPSFGSASHQTRQKERHRQRRRHRCCCRKPPTGHRQHRNQRTRSGSYSGRARRGDTSSCGKFNDFKWFYVVFFTVEGFGCRLAEYRTAVAKTWQVTTPKSSSSRAKTKCLRRDLRRPLTAAPVPRVHTCTPYPEDPPGIHLR